MSYDLQLFKLGEGQDPNARFREYMEQQEQAAVDLDAWAKRPVPESTRKRMQSLADLVRSRYSEFEQFQPERPLPWIELNHEELQVQITIGEETIGITMPYFRERAAESLALIQGCLRALRTEGFVAYDPQLDRLVDPDDVQSMLAQYHLVNDALPDIVETVAGSETSNKKPWWKIW